MREFRLIERQAGLRVFFADPYAGLAARCERERQRPGIPGTLYLIQMTYIIQ